MITENRCFFPFNSCLQPFGESIAIEYIVPKDKGNLVIPYELLTDYECFCKAIWSMLYGI